MATSSFFKTFIFDREAVKTMYNTKERSGVYNSSGHDRIKEGKDALEKFFKPNIYSLLMRKKMPII